MKKFEYKVDNKDCSRDFTRYSQGEDDFLKMRGLEGWELVSVVAKGPMTTIDRTTYYFKRELSND